MVGTILLAICDELVAGYGVDLPRLPARLRRGLSDEILELMDTARMSARLDESEVRLSCCPKRDDDMGEGPGRLVSDAMWIVSRAVCHQRAEWNRW